jgi:hypothetical protein
MVQVVENKSAQGELSSEEIFFLVTPQTRVQPQQSKQDWVVFTERNLSLFCFFLAYVWSVGDREVPQDILPRQLRRQACELIWWGMWSQPVHVAKSWKGRAVPCPHCSSR